MIERARRVDGLRRAKLRTVTVVVAVGLAASGLFAAVGQASQTPSIAFTPSPFSFGSVASGGSSSQTFTLKNTGGSASAALSISLSGSAAFAITANGCKGSLGPNKSCTVTVTYRPTTSGSSDAATLTATGNKAAADTSTALTGNSFASFNQTTCSGTSCNVSASTSTTSVNVNANGTGPSTLQAGILAGALSCGTYPSGSLNEDPNTYEVLSSSSSYSKTVTISYPASFTHDTDEESGSYDGDSDFDDVMVCFQATYPFTTRDNVTATHSSGLYTGLLPDCPAAGPCVDRAHSTFTPTDGSGIDFQFSMVVDIPANEPGDPRMN